MLVSERERRVKELTIEECLGWTPAEKGYDFTKNSLRVRFLDVEPNNWGAYVPRTLIYHNLVPTYPILSFKIDIADDVGVAEKLRRWRDNPLIDIRVEGDGEEDTPLDEVRNEVPPLILSFRHALYKQADEGARIEFLPVGELIKRLPEKRTPLIHGFIDQGEVMLFYGPSGHGVTTLILNILAAASTGAKDWMGFKIDGPLRCGYWQFEGTLTETQVRLDRLAQTYPECNVKIIAQREYQRKLSDPDIEATLINIITDHKFQIFVTDNVVNASGRFEENKSDDAKKLYGIFQRVGGETGCAQITATHTGREIPSKQSGRITFPHAPRGSSEIEGMVDWAIRYVPIDEQGREDKRGIYRRLTSYKRRASLKDDIEMTLTFDRMKELLLPVDLNLTSSAVEPESITPPLDPAAIRAIRGDRTQEQFAELIGCSISAVKKWENGTMPEDRFRRKMWDLQNADLKESI